MLAIAKLASLISLLMTILPGFLLFTGTIELDVVKWLAFIGTIIWFIVTPVWMGREKLDHSKEVEI